MLTNKAFFYQERNVSIFHYFQDDGGRIDEQIDRNTGVQASAEGLTWSYANILHSLHVREKLMVSLKEHNLA